ncbi:cob(I)yrinic acid a,c-diamide adenosyltransferase [Erythrobacteraceae bacterium CFH 75059]|uniref:cob(I)yrinic acid a,c-diamide adenosyltransferase n=1 Tax=Qipengyuania thermophila TaxID=2509361 RepID=UPI0010221936|nr:cob(I)yrinic acid a,c-diamide adenosyltransferase [Qipengyuania thermophila]TCD06771.1 cob(I)yrinic acid a,c-diamide adenosyltransferase [Erythrobacteraceae bacterium CFH 75059]
MVKLNRIYTRTGDDGTTGLVDGSRIAKSSARIEAIGAVDEANSAIGHAAVVADGDIASALFRIQNDLFDLGADLATPASDEKDFAADGGALRMVAAQTAWLEQGIDRCNAGLAPLASFVLPGGTELAARLHVARAATRRAERVAVAAALHERINPHALSYLNRLSDWLFTAARVANGQGEADVKWVPGAGR